MNKKKEEQELEAKKTGSKTAKKKTASKSKSAAKKPTTKKTTKTKAQSTKTTKKAPAKKATKKKEGAYPEPTTPKSYYPEKQEAEKKERAEAYNSVDAEVAAAQAAFREVIPPPGYDFDDEQLKIWDRVIDEFANIDWTDHMCDMAAQLTGSLYEVQLSMKQLKEEGATLEKKQIIPGKHGKPAKVVVVGVYRNPICAHLKQEREACIALRRSLGLHSRGKHGEARDAGKRHGANKKIQDGITQDDDDLLAKPPTQH